MANEKVLFQPAYKGEKPFLFISYAHKDTEMLAPFVNALQSKYRLWYDDGIDSGREWKQDIIDHINACTLLLFFVTEESLKSTYCRREIDFAESKGVPFINILVENVKIPDWFAFSFNGIQRFDYYLYQEREDFLDVFERKLSDELLEKLNETRYDVNERPSTVKVKRPIIKSEHSDKFVRRGDVILQYSGKDEVVEIPPDIIRIENKAFSNNREIKRLIIHEGLSSIGASAFIDCINLESVETPSTLRVIENYAFSGCYQLKSIKLKEGLETIKQCAFIDCVCLNDIKLPSTLKMLDEGVFMHCESIHHIDIPEGIKTLPLSLFSGCKFLMSVTLPKSLQFIQPNAFNGCKSLESIILPEELTDIDLGAFSGCENLKSITLPPKIQSIAGSCFENCFSLEKVEIQGTINYVFKYAFLNCKSLTSLILDSEFIDDGAFKNTESLHTIVLSKKLNYIGAKAFENSRASVLYEGSISEWKKIRKHRKYKANSRVIFIKDASIYKGVTDGTFVSSMSDVITEEEFYKTRLASEEMMNLFPKLIELLKEGYPNLSMIYKRSALYFSKQKDENSPVYDMFSIKVAFNTIRIELIDSKTSFKSKNLITSSFMFLKYQVIIIEKEEDIKEALNILLHTKF